MCKTEQHDGILPEKGEIRQLEGQGGGRDRYAGLFTSQTNRISAAFVFVSTEV